MKRLLPSSLLLVVFSISAAELPCSIHPPKGTPKAALPGLTKVTQADAQKTALAGFADSAGTPTVSESELEVEHGCLIFSFDVHVAGAKGVEEVLVDAGTGKVLSREHETSSQEAKEAKEEAEEAKRTEQSAKPQNPPPAG
jgi:hypothetical protein